MANTLPTYTGLVTSEHADKPNYMAMTAVIAQCYVDAQTLLASLSGAFDLDAAMGVQLDTDALWIGASRLVSIPVTNVYFAFDDSTHAVGFDQGIWYFPNNPTTSVSSLDDESFRLFLRFKVATNSWDGTMPSMYAILTELLAPAAIAISESSMVVSVTITGTPPSTLFKQLILNGALPLRPAGVAVTYTFSP